MKSSQNEISRGKYKPKEQKMRIKNVKLLHNPQEAVI